MALTFTPFVFASLVFAPFTQLRPRPQLDVDRPPDADGEAREPDDGEAHYEEDRAGRGVRQLALHADELANPAARSRHAMEEEQDASHDAGEPEDQAGKRIDQLQRRQATPEVALPGVRRQLQHGQDKLKPVQSQRLRA